MMRHIHILILALLAALPFACTDDADVWDNVPAKIATFINQYYPNSPLSSCHRVGSDWHVRIKDGPALTFNASYSWVRIAGYGETIPQVLLFDQLPPALYSYLSETSSLNSVYSIERDKTTYTVALSNTSVTYDIATGSVRSTLPPP